MTAFDTGGTQGPPPTASDSGSGSEGGGAGLNLDRFAERANETLADIGANDAVNNAREWDERCTYVVGAKRVAEPLARDVLALVERVRTLEAVAEAARAWSIAVFTGEDLEEFHALQAALAAAGGPDGQ